MAGEIRRKRRGFQFNWQWHMNEAPKQTCGTGFLKGGDEKTRCSELQNTDQYLSNICESSHLPFRLKESSIQKFKNGIPLRLFTSIHCQIYNYFNHQRHL